MYILVSLVLTFYLKKVLLQKVKCDKYAHKGVCSSTEKNAYSTVCSVESPILILESCSI